MLEDEMKAYEERGTTYLKSPYVYARLDGRGFSRFTSTLIRPYDHRFHECMVAVAKHLVRETNACFGYTQSDEISLVWKNESWQTPMFDGNQSKLTSIVASMASVKFAMSLIGWNLSEYAARYPHFDCRVLNLPSEDEACRMIQWRNFDGYRNCINSAAHHHFTHNEVLGKKQGEKIQMLESLGIDVNNTPVEFRYGTYVSWRTKLEELSAQELGKIPEQHRPPEGTMFERRSVESFTVDKYLSTVENIKDVIFRNAEPNKGWRTDL